MAPVKQDIVNWECGSLEEWAVLLGEGDGVPINRIIAFGSLQLGSPHFEKFRFMEATSSAEAREAFTFAARADSSVRIGF